MKPIEIAIQFATFEEDVTVTASPGLAQDIRTCGQPVNVISSRDIVERVSTVVAAGRRRRSPACSCSARARRWPACSCAG